VEGEDLVFRYANRQRIEQLARMRARLRVVDEQSCYLRLENGEADAHAVLDVAKSVLRPD
jgi:hypothetical protein